MLFDVMCVQHQQALCQDGARCSRQHLREEGADALQTQRTKEQAQGDSECHHMQGSTIRQLAAHELCLHSAIAVHIFLCTNSCQTTVLSTLCQQLPALQLMLPRAAAEQHSWQALRDTPQHQYGALQGGEPRQAVRCRPRVTQALEDHQHGGFHPQHSTKCELLPLLPE
jgi:hypothetical protein